MAAPTGKLNKFSTREEWLEAAVVLLAPLYSVKPAPVRVGVGFPVGKRGGNGSQTIGQCHYAAVDGVPQIFIHPEIVDPIRVLDILAHELVHAYLPIGSGHNKGTFGVEARHLGLEGPLTATSAGKDLAAALKRVAHVLGKYPHSALSYAQAKGKTQSTRMLKAECTGTNAHPDAPYIVRISATQAERGLPFCPVCYEATGELLDLQLS